MILFGLTAVRICELIKLLALIIFSNLQLLLFIFDGRLLFCHLKEVVELKVRSDCLALFLLLTYLLDFEGPIERIGVFYTLNLADLRSLLTLALI